jgi:hypothetical protein
LRADRGNQVLPVVAHNIGAFVEGCEGDMRNIVR